MALRHYTRAELAQVMDHIVGDLLTGRTPQGIQEVSTTQRYRVGSRLQIGNRVYHYAMANGVLGPQMGALVENEQDVSQEIIGANAAAGATVITLTLDNTDGPTYNGLLPANYLEGGTLMVFGALGDFIRGIKSNTAVTVNAGTATFTVVLDIPIPVAITVADLGEVMASQYRSVVSFGDTHIGNTWMTCVGVPTMATVAGNWTWLQTWGPTFLAVAAEVGDAAEDRTVYFGGDGAFRDFAGAGGENQQAGYILKTAKAGGQGLPFVMLMLDP